MTELRVPQGIAYVALAADKDNAAQTSAEGHIGIVLPGVAEGPHLCDACGIGLVDKHAAVGNMAGEHLAGDRGQAQGPVIDDARAKPSVITLNYREFF